MSVKNFEFGPSNCCFLSPRKVCRPQPLCWELRIIIQIIWLAFGIWPEFMVCEGKGKQPLKSQQGWGSGEKVKTDLSLDG